MTRFVVRPGGPLHGTVSAGGAKNSALKLMAACLLAPGRHVLAGVPRIVDVEIMAEVLNAIGAQVARAPDRVDGTPADLVIDTPVTLVPEAPYELVEKMRASVVVLGPLLAILSFVVSPLLPDHPIDPWGMVEPRSTWATVILIAALGFVVVGRKPTNRPGGPI